MSFSRLDNIVSSLTVPFVSLVVLPFLSGLLRFLPVVTFPYPPVTTTQIGLPLAVSLTDLAFDQSGLVPWGGGTFLSACLAGWLCCFLPSILRCSIYSTIPVAHHCASCHSLWQLEGKPIIVVCSGHLF